MFDVMYRVVLIVNCFLISHFVCVIFFFFFQILSRVSRQVAFGLHELLKTGAANVHTTGDWRVLFTLLECVGAGAKPPSIRGVSDTTNSVAATQNVAG